MKSSLGWKVPLRQVYCDSFASWVRQTIWCFFVIRAFPHAIDLRGDALLSGYREDAELFRDQYLFAIDAAERAQKGLPARGSLDPFSPFSA